MDDQVEVVSAKLEQISTQLKLLEIKTQDRAEAPQKPESWRSIVVQVIAIPAALVALFLQFGQAKDLPLQKDKTVAEISKTQTEELKTRAELQQLLDQLAEKKGQGIAVYQQQLDESLPKINATLDRISGLNRSLRSESSLTLLMKYVVLYIFWNALRLVFSAIGMVWNPMIAGFLITIRSRLSKSRYRERWTRLLDVSTIILAPLPNIAFTVIEIGFFVVVLWPLFDQLAASLGTDVRFQEIASRIVHLHFGQAIGLLRQVILSAAN